MNHEAIQAAIDRPARRRLALLIRRSVARLADKEFVAATKEIAARSKDPAVLGIIESFVGPEPPDFGPDEFMAAVIFWAARRRDRLPRWRSGDPFRRRARRVIARMIVFLRSDLEYRWPYYDDGKTSWGSRVFMGIMATILASVPVLLLVDIGAYLIRGEMPWAWGWSFLPLLLPLILIAHLQFWGILFMFLRFHVLRHVYRWRGKTDPYYDVWPFKTEAEMATILPKRLACSPKTGPGDMRVLTGRRRAAKETQGCQARSTSPSR
ncbi:MAG: hypothetical protein NTW19_17705 [Planctomycetota bacterium]|nr:hypothetical protein [Planctomycetota bacterium]